MNSCIRHMNFLSYKVVFYLFFVLYHWIYSLGKIKVNIAFVIVTDYSICFFFFFTSCLFSLFNYCMLLYKNGLPWWLRGKESGCNTGDLGLIPGLGRSPGGGFATHSSILAWRISWTEQPDGLQSMWSQRVRHNWVTKHSTALLIRIIKLIELYNFCLKIKST